MAFCPPRISWGTLAPASLEQADHLPSFSPLLSSLQTGKDPVCIALQAHRQEPIPPLKLII